MSGTGWRLYSVHCDCVRQERMRMLLSFMESNEARGEYSTPCEYGEAMGLPGSRYRIFYAAEREGFVRQLLVRKGPRRERVYALLERGRAWLREHERFLEILRSPSEPVERPRGRIGAAPCSNMAPVRQFDAAVRRRRAAALARAKARAEARAAANPSKPAKRIDRRFGRRRRG